MSSSVLSQAECAQHSVPKNHRGSAPRPSRSMVSSFSTLEHFLRPPCHHVSRTQAVEL